MIVGCGFCSCRIDTEKDQYVPCDKCNNVYYCSQGHMLQHKPQHKDLCQFYLTEKPKLLTEGVKKLIDEHRSQYPIVWNQLKRLDSSKYFFIIDKTKIESYFLEQGKDQQDINLYLQTKKPDQYLIILNKDRQRKCIVLLGF